MKQIWQLNEDEWLQSVVYVYRDAKGNPTSLNIRQFNDEAENGNRNFMRLQPRPNRRGLFGVTDAVYAPGGTWSGRMRTIVVEGEHNLLSLRAAVRRWGKKVNQEWYQVPVLAMGGKNGADVAALKRFLGDEEPLVVYDNDDVNEETGMPGGYDLVEAIQAELYSHVTRTSAPHKDLDDYFVAQPNVTAGDFLGMVLGAGFLPIKYATIAARIKKELGAKGLEKNERIERVTSILTADVLRRAKLFNSEGYAALLYPESGVKAELIQVASSNVRFATKMTWYGLVDEQWVEVAARAIQRRASYDDVPYKKVYSLAYWSGTTLYINCYDGSMIKMRVVGQDKRTVEAKRVPVGSDGVLLLRSSGAMKYIPWEISKEELKQITPGSMRLAENSIIDRKILSSVNYESDGPRYRQILKAWLLSQFFASSMRSRPIPMFEGVGKGGKSSVGAAIGGLFIGPDFSVNNAPINAKEVGEKMSGTPLVVWDEWDTPSKDVENAVKLLTTGGRDMRRKLYETSNVVELSCDAAVIVTSNSNPIRQVGGSRRFIVFPVVSREKDGNDEVYQSAGEHLIPSLQAHRNAMWKELLGDLARCLISLANTSPDQKTVFSMADFGVFVQRCAMDEGWGDDARELLRWVNARQEGQQAETRVCLGLIWDQLQAAPKMAGQFRSATEWVNMLQNLIAESDRELKNRVTRKFFSWETKTFKDLFERRLGMRVREDKHRKVTLYAFMPPGLLTPVVDATSDVSNYFVGDAEPDLDRTLTAEEFQRRIDALPGPAEQIKGVVQ